MPAHRLLNLRLLLRLPSRPQSRLPLRLLPPPRSQSPLPPLLRQRLSALLAVSMPAIALKAMATSAVANADQHAILATDKAAVIAVLRASTESELHPADTAVTLAAQDAVMTEFIEFTEFTEFTRLSPRNLAPMVLAMIMSLSRKSAALTVPAVDATMDPAAARDAVFARARAVTDVLTDARNAEVMDAESAPEEDSSGKKLRLSHLSTELRLSHPCTELRLSHLPCTRLSLRLRPAMAAEAKDAPDVVTEATS